jgi:hypothetical protein
VLGLLAIFALLGLVGLFGQETVESVAASPTARLRVDAPDSLRGGLLGQAKFTITAHADIAHATLVLDHGWTEQVQLNTIVPNPLVEADRGDRLARRESHWTTACGRSSPSSGRSPSSRKRWTSSSAQSSFSS